MIRALRHFPPIPLSDSDPHKSLACTLMLIWLPAFNARMRGEHDRIYGAISIVTSIGSFWPRLSRRAKVSSRPVPAARISPELSFNSQNAFAHGVIVDTPCQLTSESCLMAS